MIRVANINDLNGILDIYNQAIAAGFQTAFEEPFDEVEGTKWLGSHLNDRYPLFVFESGESIMGWASISPYRQGRAALDGTVEVSYFVHKDHFGKGIGLQLLTHTINSAIKLRYKTAVAIILDKNIPSIRLIEKAGFAKWGHLPGVAKFGNTECGHLYYGIRL